MSWNHGTIFLPLAPNLCNNVNKNKILDEKVEIIRNELVFLFTLSMCKLGFTQFVSDSLEFTHH